MSNNTLLVLLIVGGPTAVTTNAKWANIGLHMPWEDTQMPVPDGGFSAENPSEYLQLMYESPVNGELGGPSATKKNLPLIGVGS